MENGKWKNRLLLGAIIISGVLLLIYFIIAVYFTNHFYYGSAINCISVSGMSVNEVKNELPNEVEKYSLKLIGRDNINEIINGNDIDLQLSINKDIEEIKDNSQNPLGWITSLFTNHNINEEEMITFNEEKLKDKIKKLNIVIGENIIEPKNASYIFENGQYKIVTEIPGSKINQDNLYKEIIGAISSGEREINLEEKDCYEKPKYKSDSEEIIETRDTLNDYVNTEISYKFGDKIETIDKSIIGTWLHIDDYNNITFNKEEINKYLQTICSKYNTVGKTRQFSTSTGEVIKVSGGDYGWSINKKIECEELINIIKESKPVTKEPSYLQKADNHSGQDFGNTYIEINLQSQYLWFYKNGNIIAEGSIVTGDIYNGCATPAGVYSLKYKERNAILRGEDYETPVSFWMPFNNGIGVHDAVWRSVFGGNIYMGNGSHGCVNASYTMAESIFNNIEPGTAVICYN
ncbi:MAG: L,D-transpeptidase family protein [Clostridiales bacterium]|nr:L,D-transpeptidase family protein [Clostridiales bacterium]